MRSRPSREPGPRALAALAAALLAAAPAPGRALDDATPGSGGALKVTAEPPRLLLGRDGGAELKVAAPPEVEELSLTASAGRVEGLRRLPGGGFVARYRPPPERYPQVAIVAALARGPRGPLDGWLAIPLSGQGDARVRAQPGAEIALRVGDRTFGPRRAGDDGVAVIPVVVPPGVREAHHGFNPIDLHVPETPLLHAACDRAQVHADRLEQVHVVAYVVAPHGAARRGDDPAFEPTRGSVSMAPREPGAFEGTWTLPPGTAGEQRLVVRLPGAAASRAVLRLDALPGPPATVAVAFDRADATAGAEGVEVTARVLDSAGNAVPSPLVLDADGTALAAAADADGTLRARVPVPRRLGARRELVVTARATAVSISGARALALRPGPPAQARWSPAQPVVLADGARDALLRVEVADAFGNPVDAAPTVTAARGIVRAVEPRETGAWLVSYRAPAGAARGEDALTLEAGEARARADVLLVPPRTGLSFLGSAGAAFDARGRFTAPTAGLAVELAARPSALPAGAALAWRLEAHGLAWSGPGDLVQVSRRTTAEGPDADLRAVALLGGAGGTLTLRRGPELGATAGLGVLLGRRAPPGGPSDSGAALAARVGLSAGWRLRLGTPFLEASLLAAGGSPAGAFAAIGIAAGFRFDLETPHGDDPHRR